METEQEYQSKKKKKSFRSKKEINRQVIDQPQVLKEVLISIFKYHIGEQNFISPYDLFVRIYGKDPFTFDVFKRMYLWDLIKKQLAELRSTNSLFTILKHGKIFLLRTEEELQGVHDRNNKHIEALKKLNINATEWVKQEKWKRL